MFYFKSRCSVAWFARFLFDVILMLALGQVLPGAAFAASEETTPRLLLSGSQAVVAENDGKKEPEPPRISSVFGTQTLKEYKLPFEDQYPSGPFERLDKKLFLFISKCGDVFFVRQNEAMELVKPGKALAKFIPTPSGPPNRSWPSMKIAR